MVKHRVILVTHNTIEQDLFIEHTNLDWYLNQTLIKNFFYKKIFL